MGSRIASSFLGTCFPSCLGPHLPWAKPADLRDAHPVLRTCRRSSLACLCYMSLPPEPRHRPEGLSTRDRLLPVLQRSVIDAPEEQKAADGSVRTAGVQLEMVRFTPVRMPQSFREKCFLGWG